MPRCDRCEEEIPISSADVDSEETVTPEMLRDVHEPDDDPFTIIEGSFAVWTADLDVESRGRFPLLLCRECTSSFVDWVDNPAITPEQDEADADSIEWSYVD